MGIAERREREKEQRRGDIVDAAERVFFTKGWREATMDDVAAEAELAKATLYLYFKSKEDLYSAIQLRGSRVLHDRFAAAVAGVPSGVEKVEAIGRAYVRFFTDHRDYFDAMLYFESTDLDPHPESAHAGECEQLGRDIMGLVATALKAGVDDGTVRADIDPMRVAFLLWGQTTGILQIASMKGRDMEEGFGITPEDLLESYFDFVEKALRPRP
ncbi:MAG: TetR/AcrR family transcriptional regulator [Candidatus Krumholzibacteria bacterium]|nr:TetR/AcrR family transcriptional regulator [Candidatus Krumholzibacteria bacterium]